MRRRLRWLVPIAALTVLGAFSRNALTTNGGSTSFEAAYLNEGYGSKSPLLLTLFPLDGAAYAVRLPPGLPGDFNLVAFGPDGKAIYGQPITPRPQDGITKIEFNPPRQSTVPGTVGLGLIWHLAVSQESGRVLAAGWSKKIGSAECGTFEIDPATGGFRILRAGVFPGCGGGGGPVSSDGRHGLTYSGKKLGLIDLETGAVQDITGIDAGAWSVGGTWLSNCTWSPDGRWIAAIRDGRILLIDALDLSHRVGRGAADRGNISWSPDSKLLLLSKSQFSCGLTLYSSSLEIVYVETGKRKIISSSHCQVAVPNIGWLNAPAIR